MKLPVVIIGAGGHAKVVADALLAARARVLGFTDADGSRHNQKMCGDLAVLGDDRFLESYTPATLTLANGIGGVSSGPELLRHTVNERLVGSGWRFVSVRHPAAVVSAHARLGDSVQIFAGGVVQVGADVGTGCIVNAGAIVEHDVRLGPWVHVAPGAIVCGDVVIGQRSHIGAGAVVRQGVRLGDDTVVGSGAVVVCDFPGGGVLVGVPARSREQEA
jgi:sugar O-acyltransferase (sialic acid O-acetyltransferase NeuD family)